MDKILRNGQIKCFQKFKYTKTRKNYLHGSNEIRAGQTNKQQDDHRKIMKIKLTNKHAEKEIKNKRLTDNTTTFF